MGCVWVTMHDNVVAIEFTTRLTSTEKNSADKPYTFKRIIMWSKIVEIFAAIPVNANLRMQLDCVNRELTISRNQLTDLKHKLTESQIANENLLSKIENYRKLRPTHALTETNILK